MSYATAAQLDTQRYAIYFESMLSKELIWPLTMKRCLWGLRIPMKILYALREFFKLLYEQLLNRMDGVNGFLLSLLTVALAEHLFYAQ